MTCVSSIVGHETDYAAIRCYKKIIFLIIFNHYYFMTTAYSSEIPDNFFEDKLQCKKIRTNCSLQTAMKYSLFWNFKIKAEILVSANW